MSVSTYQKSTAVVLALTVAATLGAPAFAAGYSEPVMAAPVAAPVPVMVAPVYNNVSDWSGFYAGASLGYGDVEGDVPPLGTDISGLTYGVHAGYNYDLGNYVVGGELEYSMADDITDDVSGLEVDSVLRAKARVGYDMGSFMPYATVGAAQLTTTGAIDDHDTGWLYGVGADYMVTDSIVVGAEVLQHQFDDYAGTGVDVQALTAEARVSFKF